jgi:DNA-binding MarR family transcriptional regulator
LGIISRHWAVQKLHQQLLEVVKVELDLLGARDINNMQLLILFNIGKDELTVGELTQRGYYHGTSVTYNLKKLVEAGYFMQERSAHNRRLVHVWLTEKGLELCTKLHVAFERRAHALAGGIVSPDDLAHANRAFERMSRPWGSGAFRFANTEVA